MPTNARAATGDVGSRGEVEMLQRHKKGAGAQVKCTGAPEGVDRMRHTLVELQSFVNAAGAAEDGVLRRSR